MSISSYILHNLLISWITGVFLEKGLPPFAPLLHLTPYTLHLHFSMPIENFFAYAILRAALFSAASPAEGLWLVGNNINSGLLIRVAGGSLRK